MVQFFYLGIETTYFILGLIAMITTLNNWRDNKNRVLIAISVYIAAVLGRSMIDIAVYAFGFNLDVIVLGYLTIGMVIGNLLFVIQLVFMFFLKKYTKLYTLPFYIAFYLMLGRILVDSIWPFVIYAMIVSYSSAYFLIRDGKRKQNGLAIGMGLFFLLYGIGQTIQVELGFVIFRLISMIALLLGTKGFYEKYVWPNQQEEQRIMNTWITKFVVKD